MVKLRWLVIVRLQISMASTSSSVDNNIHKSSPSDVEADSKGVAEKKDDDVKQSASTSSTSSAAAIPLMKRLKQPTAAKDKHKAKIGDIPVDLNGIRKYRGRFTDPELYHIHGLAGLSSSQDVIELLLEMGYSPTTNAINGAVEGQDVDMMEWLHEEKKFPFDSNTFNEAVYTNNTEIMQWLFTRACPIDHKDATRIAIQIDSVNTLKWLFNVGLIDWPTVRLSLGSMSPLLDCRAWLEYQMELRSVI
jgi:hypothetical protein